MVLEMFESVCEECGKALTVIRDNNKTKTYHCSECSMKLQKEMEYKDVTEEFQ